MSLKQIAGGDLLENHLFSIDINEFLYTKTYDSVRNIC